MSPTDCIWMAYLRLYFSLKHFAEKYAAEAWAGLYARQAVAELVLSALAGARTPWGPYAAAYELLSVALEHGFHADQGVTAVPSVRAIPLASEDEANALSTAYWAVFQAGCFANLTNAEIMFISALIEQYEPPSTQHATLGELITLGRGDLEPLRRVFWAAEEHECDGSVICVKTRESARADEAKHRRWLDAMRREEAMI